MKNFTILVLAMLVAGCTQPLVMIPGGKLKGEVTPAPKSWSTVPDVIQLEVRPDDPYSLNIWAVVADDHLHVATREAKWLPMLAVDKNVRVKIDGLVYEMAAEKLSRVGDLDVVAKTYLAKYEIDEPWLTETQVYRLTARR